MVLTQGMPPPPPHTQARHHQSRTLCPPLQVVLGVGIVAAGLYAVNTYVLPYARELINAWNAKRKVQEVSTGLGVR